MFRGTRGRWAIVIVVVAVVLVIAAVLVQARGSHFAGRKGAARASPIPVRPSPLVARMARPDAALVPAQQPYRFTDDQRGIDVELADFGGARNLSAAVRVVRQWELRNDAGRDTTMSFSLTAAGPDVVGVAVAVDGRAPGRPPQAAPGQHLVTLWYDSQSGRVATSPALIAADHWQPFVDAVIDRGRATGEVGPAGLDEATLRGRLAAEPAPVGAGPAMAFSQAGDLVLDLGTGTSYAIPGEVVAPHLSELGRRAREASINPRPATGAALPATPTPKAATSKATPNGTPVPSSRPRSGSPVPSRSASASTPGATADSSGPTPTAAAGEQRPSDAVGTDCRRVACVALTYDDGPIAGNSDTVLAALTKTGVPATFFQMGQNLRNNRDTGRAIVSAGNEVGSHTLNHPDLTKSRKLEQEVNGQAELMRQTYGFAPMLMRPPYGARNAKVEAVAGAQSEAVINWDVDTLDWKHRDPGQTKTSALTVADHPGGIVLMHDIHMAAGAATEGIVTELRRRGIQPVTVTEMSLTSGVPEPGATYCTATFVAPRGYGCSDTTRAQRTPR